jgi:uncharacterized linocin/CFP29 family protein
VRHLRRHLLRRSQPVVELRVPFTVARQQVDDIVRGARDADWQLAEDAARRIAFAEDRAIFEGYPAAGITGIRDSASNPPIGLPGEVREYPGVVAQAVSALRLAGVGGPYTLALSADAYTAVSETSDHGYPIYEHIARLYFQESLTFLVASEAVVPLTAPEPSG